MPQTDQESAYEGRSGLQVSLFTVQSNQHTHKTIIQSQGDSAKIVFEFWVDDGSKGLAVGKGTEAKESRSYIVRALVDVWLQRSEMTGRMRCL